MFGLQFYSNQKYQKEEGSSVPKAVLFALGTSVVITAEMFVFRGGKIECTWFSLGFAVLGAIVSVLFSYCSVAAMEKVNLSLYSLFAMLGGMLLPFLDGIWSWGEEFNWKKGLSIGILFLAMLIGVSLRADLQSLKYCALVFVLNGMVGVISKWHQSFPDRNISSGGFMLLKSAITVLLCLVLLLFFKKENRRWRHPKKSVLYIGEYGVLNGFANLFVLISLMHVPSSVQYPMITGGTIIVSTILGYLGGEKPTRKNVIAAALAMSATLLLV
ncbi:MAG: hypothetical protein J6B85_01925 [Lachnospiraceae bacterium]|nr:hypothetical protein [Lachnospiraceae bacterium]